MSEWIAGWVMDGRSFGGVKGGTNRINDNDKEIMFYGLHTLCVRTGLMMHLLAGWMGG